LPFHRNIGRKLTLPRNRQWAPPHAFAGGEPPTSNCTPAPNGGFVPDFGTRRSFVINEIGGFVFEKLSGFSHLPSASRPLKARLVLHFCPLPFAFCHSFLFLAYRLLSPFLTTQTVASFLFSARSDPLLSVKSVASFFEKLSAFSR